MSHLIALLEFTQQQEEVIGSKWVIGSHLNFRFR